MARKEGDAVVNVDWRRWLREYGTRYSKLLEGGRRSTVVPVAGGEDQPGSFARGRDEDANDLGRARSAGG